MCGIVGAIADRDVVPLLIDGLKRLEYRGYDSAGIAVLGDDCVRRVRRTGRVAEMEAAAAGRRLHVLAGHRPHPLGDARRRHRGQRASARQPRRDRAGAQRHHREPRAAARTPARARLRRSNRRPTPRSSRTSSTTTARRARRCWARCRPRSASSKGAYAIAVIDKRDPDAHGRRAHGVSAAGGPRRRRELRRLRRFGDRLVDAPGDLPGGRRHRRTHARGRARVRCRRQSGAARRAPVRRVAGVAGARPVPPFHAEGDPRAAARDRRHDRSAGRRRRVHRRPVRTRCRRRAARHRQRADPRLRHQLLRRADRALLDRGDGRHSVLGRGRQRIPLSRRRRQPQAADRHHLAVGRNARHDGGAEVRQVARPRPHAVDLQRAGKRDPARQPARLLHPRRRRDRRRVDQGVHHAARRAVHADGDAGEAARPAVGRAGSRTAGSAAPPARQRAARAQPGAADRAVGRAFRAEAARVVPRPRRALSDRAGRRA